MIYQYDRDNNIIGVIKRNKPIIENISDEDYAIIRRLDTPLTIKEYEEKYN